MTSPSSLPGAKPEGGNESTAHGPASVELQQERFRLICIRNARRGYGPVPLDLKEPWERGHHGWDAVEYADEFGLPDREDIWRMAWRIGERLRRGEPGRLNPGARLPKGVVGIDVDAHDGKTGATTLAAHESRLGLLLPTYRVTARGRGSKSGIRMYRVPGDWLGPGALRADDGTYGHVDIIQAHLRYIAAPGALHPTGRRYRLYSPDGLPTGKLTLPIIAELPCLPEAWLAALRREARTARRTGQGCVRLRVAAEEWVEEAQPGQLKRTVCRVEATGWTGDTRNTTRDALCTAARKARAGVYPWATAVAAIEQAAREAYAERSVEFDEAEFGRLADFAIEAALAMPEADLARHGIYNGGELAGAQVDGFMKRLDKNQSDE